MPDFGVPKENIVFISRHRLLQPLAVLHEHLRLPHHPRPRADARHRPQGRATRADGVGHHRRRRRAVDRRQPRPALDAAQRRHQDGHVQQPHLRPDQGPGLADVRAWARRPSHRPLGTIDYPIQPLSIALAAEATLRRALGRHDTEHLQETLNRAGSTTARRSSRSSRTATSSTTAPTATSPSARCATTGCSSSSTASR